MKTRLFLALLALGLAAPGNAPAETRAAAVVDDGYAGRVLLKIMKSFSGKVAQGQRLEAKLYVDAEGKYLECGSLKGDTKALCQAAKNASPYGDPPYGVPTEIVIAVWAGKQPVAAPAEAENKQNTAKQTGAVDSKYLNKIRRELRNAMYIPAKTKPGTYHATVRISCDAAGKILQSSIVKSSGDSLLDKYVLQGIKRAGAITAPPKGSPETFDLTFTLVRQ